MDEKGFMQGIFEKSKVIISRDERFQGKSFCIQDGSREWTTVIDCVSIGGRYLSPWIIFKGVYCKKQWVDRLIAYDPKGKITMSYNGWTDNCIGYKWFQECFIPETGGESLHGEYRLMLFDGHSSHISSDVIRLCLKHKVILLCLPPHTTHLLQPLDIGLFGPLASYYKSFIRALCKFGYNYSIDKLDFLDGYLYAREKAFTIKNIISAWKKAGLHPYAPELIIDKMTPLEMPLKERPITPPSVTSTASETPLTDTLLLQPTLFPPPPKTPANVSDIRCLLNQHRAALFTPDDLERVFLKVTKAAEKAMAEALTYKDHNEGLQDAAVRKMIRGNRTKGNLAIKDARTYGKAELNERSAWWCEEYEKEVLKVFMGYKLDIFDFKAKLVRKGRLIPDLELCPIIEFHALFDSPQRHASPIKSSPKKRTLAKTIKAPKTILGIAKRTKAVKVKPSLILKLWYGTELEIVGKIRDIIEIRTRTGRIIKPTAKHVNKRGKP